MKIKRLSVALLTSLVLCVNAVPVFADATPTESQITPYGQRAYCSTCGTLMSSTTHYGTWVYIGQRMLNGKEYSLYQRTVTMKFICYNCGYDYSVNETQSDYR